VTAAREPCVVTGPGVDWDEILTQEAGQDRLVVNLGPQHPSTHRALRVVLELEGETV
jgi:NADH-quinone oxidoreductase subunit D